MSAIDAAGAEAAPMQATEQPVFFYGTLRDQDLLALVLDRSDLSDLKQSPASVEDHRVGRVAGQSFPMLFKAPGQAAHGVLVYGLSVEDRARLDFFEDSDYAFASIEVIDAGAKVSAIVYTPSEKLRDSGESWDFDRWRAEDKALLIECAREQMSYFGRAPQTLVEFWWPDIVARAEIRLGLAEGIRSDRGRDDVQAIHSKTPYKRYFSVEEHRVRFRTFAGAPSGGVEREVFVSGDAVAVLPYDPVANKVLLIEQWRAGPWAAGDANPWTIEAIAGRIDPGETAEQTARREALEEAGIEIGRIEALPPVYVSPGILAERLTSFIGEADLSRAGGVHGLVDEGEDIRVVVLDFWEAMTAVARGDVNALPAIAALLWLARNRDRLLLEWIGD